MPLAPSDRSERLLQCLASTRHRRRVTHIVLLEPFLGCSSKCELRPLFMRTNLLRSGPQGM
jgi:hypothetical protein